MSIRNSIASIVLAFVFFATMMFGGVDHIIGPQDAKAASKAEIRKAKTGAGREIRKACKRMNVEKFVRVVGFRGSVSEKTLWKTRCLRYQKRGKIKCRELAGPFLNDYRKISCSPSFSWIIDQAPDNLNLEPTFYAPCWSNGSGSGSAFGVHYEYLVTLKGSAWSSYLSRITRCHRMGVLASLGGVD